MINSINTKRLLSCSITFVLLLSLAPNAFAGVPPNPNITFGQCGPMDVAIIFDTTGSMTGAINSVKSGLGQIIADAQQASGNQLRLGLIEVNGLASGQDIVRVHWPLTNNIAGVQGTINTFTASGGAALPEATDQGKATAIFNRDLAGSPYADADGAMSALLVGPNAPTGFDIPWTGSTNIAILITDDIAGGFNDAASAADDALIRSLGTDAANHVPPIRMSDILVDNAGFTNHAQSVSQLTDDANNSGGVFIEAPLGVGTAAAISSIIEQCGGAGVIGGEILPIDASALFVAGALTNAIWMAPVLAGAASAAALYIKTRKN